MKCAICRNGNTEPGLINSTLERDGVFVIIKEVSAHICSNCREELIDEEISRKLLIQAEEAFKAGSPVEIRKFAS